MLTTLLVLIELVLCFFTYSINMDNGFSDLMRSVPFYISIFFPLIIWYWVRRKRANNKKMFHNWLLENKHNIETGSAKFNEITVTPETKLVRYHVALSFIIISVRKPSPEFYIIGSPLEKRVRFGYTLCSLIFGWWGIIGPIFTIQVLYWNLSRKHTITVRQLMNSTEMVSLAKGRVEYKE